jgi:hypothetical protein
MIEMVLRIMKNPHLIAKPSKKPEGLSVNSPEHKLSLLPTGETGGRPEGPTVNRPDRKVGITQLSEKSAEGAAPRVWIRQVSHLRRSFPS